MNNRREGGPAFPVPDLSDHEGMTLRDWFAGQALNGLVAGGLRGTYAKEVVMHAYEIADTMIQFRQATGPQARAESSCED